jgi:lipoprotein NlpI
MEFEVGSLGRHRRGLGAHSFSAPDRISEGDSLAVCGDYAAALIEYNLALRADPVQIEAYNGRSLVRVCQGRYDLALEDADTALTLAHENAAAFRNRGLALYYHEYYHSHVS